MRRLMAWGVHALTASGAVVGFVAVVATAEHMWMAAFALMAVTIIIDAVDGSLARRFDVKRFAPNLDGQLLDNIVDYFTYVIVPAYLLYESGILPKGWGLVSAAVMLVASGYQFCQSDAKTDDHYFKGFPSYWNIAAFYLFMFGLPPWASLAIIVLLALAVFVPIKYVYPSRTEYLRGPTLVLSVAWGAMLVAAMAMYPRDSRLLLLCSLAYVAYYTVLSIHLTFAGGMPCVGESSE